MVNILIFSTDKIKKTRGNKIKVYTTWDEIHAVILQHSLLVGVFVSNSDKHCDSRLFYVVIGGYSDIHFHKVHYTGTNLGQYSPGLWYQEIEIDSTPFLSSHKREMNEDPQLCVLFMPMIY